MANNNDRKSQAVLYELQQPEKLSNVLAKDSVDCLSCRIMGAAAFGGLGAYSYYTGHQQLAIQRHKILQSGSMFGMRSRQTAITGIAITFVGLGAWRLVN